MSFKKTFKISKHALDRYRERIKKGINEKEATKEIKELQKKWRFIKKLNDTQHLYQTKEPKINFVLDHYSQTILTLFTGKEKNVQK